MTVNVLDTATPFEPYIVSLRNLPVLLHTHIFVDIISLTKLMSVLFSKYDCND